MSIWDAIKDWNWKLGFDYPSLILWGEPKFPMPEEEE